MLKELAKTRCPQHRLRRRHSDPRCRVGEDAPEGSCAVKSDVWKPAVPETTPTRIHYIRGGCYQNAKEHYDDHTATLGGWYRVVVGHWVQSLALRVKCSQLCLDAEPHTGDLRGIKTRSAP